jgi:hypothetical protein
VRNKSIVLGVLISLLSLTLYAKPKDESLQHVELNEIPKLEAKQKKIKGGNNYVYSPVKVKQQTKNKE